MTHRKHPVSTAEASLTELEAEVKAAGYTSLARKPYDNLLLRVLITGPRTGYPHAFTLDLMGKITVREFIEDREDALEAKGYVPCNQLKYRYYSDRDDDGDRYIYDHYAVAENGKRVPLDVSSTTSYLEPHEFALMAMFGFPTRLELGYCGPVRVEDLERKVFNGQGHGVTAGARRQGKEGREGTQAV